MLVSPTLEIEDSFLQHLFSVLGDNTPPSYLMNGVVKIGHHNGGSMLREQQGWNAYESEYPTLVAVDGDYFPCYGVCDNPEQILEQCASLHDPERRFVVFVTPVLQDDQPEDGGWRWHKWGEYIGDMQPQCEYLYDEPEIDQVYCFHIYEQLLILPRKNNHG